MIRFIKKNFDKLFFKRWIIGICRDNIKDIIRNKTFDPEINWMFQDSRDIYYADPFIFSIKNEEIKILLEEFPFEENYGKISMVTLDRNFKQKNYKGILDTKSHISYPTCFTENNKIYMFPEAGMSGKLSCYEFDPVKETVVFLKHIIDLPLRDSTLIKHNGKYWLFGTLTDFSKKNETKYELHVFYSDNLLGPYVSHPKNPIRRGLDGTRSGGNFIDVDGVIYRPAQNCQVQYGDSMTINKISELNEINVTEEPYFTIFINKKNKLNRGMQTIHTINELDGYIVVDGIKSDFAPFLQMQTYFRNRRLRNSLKDQSVLLKA